MKRSVGRALENCRCRVQSFVRSRLLHNFEFPQIYIYIHGVPLSRVRFGDLLLEQEYRNALWCRDGFELFVVRFCYAKLCCLYGGYLKLEIVGFFDIFYVNLFIDILN